MLPISQFDPILLLYISAPLAVNLNLMCHFKLRCELRFLWGNIKPPIHLKTAGRLTPLLFGGMCFRIEVRTDIIIGGDKNVEK